MKRVQVLLAVLLVAACSREAKRPDGAAQPQAAGRPPVAVAETRTGSDVRTGEDNPSTSDVPESPRAEPAWRRLASELKARARGDQPLTDRKPAERPGADSSPPPEVLVKAERARDGKGERPVEPQRTVATTNRGGRSTTPSPQTSTAPETVTPDDGESDRSAPRVGEISITPNEIEAGASAVITMRLLDDMSGVRGGSGSLRSPGGAASVGFGLEKISEDGMYSGRFSIPKEAEAGIWYVASIYASDNANNAGSLNFSGATAPVTGRLRVVSESSDSAGPELKHVSVQKSAIDEGESNQITLIVEDDRSEVAGVTGVFLGPSSAARVGFSARQIGTTSEWRSDIFVPRGGDCGKWTLNQVQMVDSANNHRFVYAGTADSNLEPAAFNVTTEACDGTAPRLVEIRIDPSVIGNSEAGVVQIVATVTDEGVGTSNVSGRFEGPAADSNQPPRIYFSLLPDPADPTRWFGVANIPRFSARGAWRMAGVQVADKASNTRHYTLADPVLANGHLSIE